MIVAVIVYLLSMTVANLLAAKFGPAASPVIAFFLIGLDLSLRDWLHVRLKAWQMLALIAVAGLITYALSAGAGRIAVASVAAFALAALADWAVFAMAKGSWTARANKSNIAGAAVDSLVFPSIAFGALMPEIIALQFAAKMAGGALWAMAISKWRAA